MLSQKPTRIPALTEPLLVASKSAISRFCLPNYRGVRCGWIGVDLFFCLSSCLMATLLLREQQTTENMLVALLGFTICTRFYILIKFWFSAGPRSEAVWF